MTGNDGAATSHSALIDQCTRLRTAIAQTLARIEEIRQQEIPQIKADYATKIGVWNTRLIIAQLGARRAKRRCALARVSSNQGKQVDAEHISRQLDEEFAQWKQRVAQETTRLHHLLKWRGGVRPMSPAKAKELNKLFRTLARRFHPDLYPGDEERADYYATAQNALACGDLELLRALDVATAHMADGVDYSRLTLDELATECELLEDHLASCKTKLAELTSTEPYTLRGKLADPEWVSATVDGLRTTVEAFEREQARYDEEYRRLVKEN